MNENIKPTKEMSEALQSMRLFKYDFVRWRFA